MCGNGARAILHLAEKRNRFTEAPQPEKEIPVKISGADCKAMRLEKDASFAVKLGQPKYENLDIVPIADQNTPVHKVNAGNLHIRSVLWKRRE